MTDMDLFDRLALAGRRYVRRLSAVSGSPRLDLDEVLRLYDRKAILDVTIRPNGQQPQHMKPDSERKLKLSLLDMLSELHPEEGSWYEIFETAPTGDNSKVRILVSGESGPKGEVQMLMGRRTLDNYFAEDPVLESIRQATGPT